MLIENKGNVYFCTKYKVYRLTRIEVFNAVINKLKER